MTDIISMLAQAQNKAQSESNSRQNDVTNNSVATFFMQASTNPNSSTMPIQIQQQKNMTLSDIEKHIPKFSPPNHDTQNNNNNNINNNNNNNNNINVSQNIDLANSPLAKFLNSSNFNANNAGQAAQRSQASAPPPGFNILSSQPKNGTNGSKETAKLITPNMLAQSNNNNNNNNINTISNGGEKKQPEPLTKNQLVQALKYLIENDDEFTKKIHDAYLKSLSS